jgi:hypothetical protein
MGCTLERRQEIRDRKEGEVVGSRLVARRHGGRGIAQCLLETHHLVGEGLEVNKVVSGVNELRAELGRQIVV